MTVDEVVKYFGSGNQAALKMGVKRHCIYNWRKRGSVPMLAQMHLQEITKGALCADGFKYYKDKINGRQRTKHTTRDEGRSDNENQGGIPVDEGCVRDLGD